MTMKTFSVLFVVVSLVTFSSSYVYHTSAPSTIDPEHLNECRDPDLGIYYKKSSETQQRPEKCEVVTCKDDLSMVYYG